VDGLISRSGTAQHGTDLVQTKGPRGTVRPGADEVPTTKISPEERALPRIEDGFYYCQYGRMESPACDGSGDVGVDDARAAICIIPRRTNLSSPEQPKREAK
jgi:hypothetical protein